MTFIHILVEGQSEETLITNLLKPHFESINIYVNPVIIQTKRTPSKKFKGGGINYEKVRKQLFNLLNDTSAKLVTTMLDYYALSKDFPGYETIPDGLCYDRVRYLSEKFSEDINHPRFLPFITLHEFEAFLFVSPEKIADRFPSYKILNKLIKIRESFSSPEEINDGQDTHPSARLERLINRYEKVNDGLAIAKNIGLNQIRSECPHFNEWLQQLENL